MCIDKQVGWYGPARTGMGTVEIDEMQGPGAAHTWVGDLILGIGDKSCTSHVRDLIFFRCHAV